MRGLDHATILSPSFHGVHKNAWHNDLPFVSQKNDQKFRRGYFKKNWVGCAARFLKLLPYFTPKSVIFPTLFQT